MERSAVRSEPGSETVHWQGLRVFTRSQYCHSRTTMAEQSFRNNLSQFRWARGVTDDSQPAQPQANPFARFYNAVAGDYVPLRSSERSTDDDAYLALSRWERLLGFGACLVGACVCFFFAFLGLPWLPIRPAKFALAFRFVRPPPRPPCSPSHPIPSMGSLLVMVGQVLPHPSPAPTDHVQTAASRCSWGP